MNTLKINQFSPCSDGLMFYNNFLDFESAWDNCQRGDWMLWIAKRLDVDLLILTTAKAVCANTVRHLMKDERSTKSIDIAILFGRGEATKEELNAAAAAAAAAYAAYAYARKEMQIKILDYGISLLKEE